MPVYKVPVNGQNKMVKADNKAQAVRAATLPLVGKVETLTPDEIADLSLSGVPLIDASKVLSDEPAAEVQSAQGELPEQQQEQDGGEWRNGPPQERGDRGQPRRARSGLPKVGCRDRSQRRPFAGSEGRLLLRSAAAGQRQGLSPAI